MYLLFLLDVHKTDVVHCPNIHRKCFPTWTAFSIIAALMHGQPLSCIQHSSQFTVALLQDQAQQAALLLHKACKPHLRQMVCPQLTWRLTQSTFGSLALHPKGTAEGADLQWDRLFKWNSGAQQAVVAQEQQAVPSTGASAEQAPLQQVWQQIFANLHSFTAGRQFLSAKRLVLC